MEIHVLWVSDHFLGGQNMTVWAFKSPAVKKTAPKGMFF